MSPMINMYSNGLHVSEEDWTGDIRRLTDASTILLMRNDDWTSDTGEKYRRDKELVSI